MTVEDIAFMLSVSNGVVSNWTTDLESAKKESEAEEIIELWLKCKTQDEIANIFGKTQGRIAQIIKNFKNEKINNQPESLQIYDIWQGNC